MVHMSHSLNSLKWGYIWDYMMECFRDYQGGVAEWYHVYAPGSGHHFQQVAAWILLTSVAAMILVEWCVCVCARVCVCVRVITSFVGKLERLEPQCKRPWPLNPASRTLNTQEKLKI